MDAPSQILNRLVNAYHVIYCLTGNGISIRNGSRSAGLGPVFGVTLWIAVDRCFFLAEIGARGDITSSDPSPVFFAMRGGHALI